MAELFDMKELEERVILVAVSTSDEDDTEASLDELEELADTAGAEVVGQFLQKKDKPDTALFIGRGRADELCRQCQALEADLCIFDEELTGIQARNLEEILRVKVVDRTTLTCVEGLQAVGILLDTDLYVPDNFLLEKEGVTFLYNTYDIAPYYMGRFQLTVPYEEINTYLIKK